MKLTDKFTLEQGRVYLTGIQALVRLPIDQMRRDRRAGLDTGGFISGYEGSPLGGYDMALARAGKLLSEHNIHFRPAVNEDLAATAVMGSQIYDVIGSKVQGVVGIWYGKGPGATAAAIFSSRESGGDREELLRAGAVRRRSDFQKLHHPEPE
jgi:indolepyruvate ferredoxin oxidoreductase